MDKRTKTKWIKALRSGKFKQGRDRLSQGRGEQKTFCCLGVLCEVTGTRYRGRGDYLPRQLAKEVGLDRTQQMALADKNDWYGWSFKKIADFIEKEL